MILIYISNVVTENVIILSSYLLNYPNSVHHKYSAFSDDLNNNFIESDVALITTFIYHYNFLHEHSSLNNLTPAMVAGANYSDKDIKNWMLF